MRPHDVDPVEPLPTLQPAFKITLPFTAGAGFAVAVQRAVEWQNAEAWLRALDPALVPIAAELSTSTTTSAYEAADLVATWWHGLPVPPADELRILTAAGQADTFRAAGLRLQVAAAGLMAPFAAVAAAAVAAAQAPEAPTPQTRRERRAAARAARRTT